MTTTRPPLTSVTSLAIAYVHDQRMDFYDVIGDAPTLARLIGLGEPSYFRLANGGSLYLNMDEVKSIEFNQNEPIAGIDESEGVRHDD